MPQIRKKSPYTTRNNAETSFFNRCCNCSRLMWCWWSSTIHLGQLWQCVQLICSVYCTSMSDSYSQWVQRHADTYRRQTTISSYLQWHKQVYIFWHTGCDAFSALMLLVGWPEGHLACKTSILETLEMVVNTGGQSIAQNTVWWATV